MPSTLLCLFHHEACFPLGSSVSLPCPGPRCLLPLLSVHTRVRSLFWGSEHVCSFFWFRQEVFRELWTSVSFKVASRLCSLQSTRAPRVLSHVLVTSWQCVFLGTRFGEASHPGPFDILGAALSEATPPLPSQDFPDATLYSAASCQDSGPVPSFSDAPPGSSASSWRPVFQRSSQPPLSKRRASSSGRWYCPVPSCPDHCPLTRGGWSFFGAMKGHRVRCLRGLQQDPVLSVSGSMPVLLASLHCLHASSDHQPPTD